jgi:hypothetical protein
MSGDLTSSEQSIFAEDTQEMKLPVYKTAEGDKIVVNPGSKAPSTAKKTAGRRKTKRRSKKRSLLKSRKVR